MIGTPHLLTPLSGSALRSASLHACRPFHFLSSPGHSGVRVVGAPGGRISSWPAQTRRQLSSARRSRMCVWRTRSG